MASSKEYRDYILEQLSELEDIKTKPMMGEFLLYYKGVYVAGICDNRLLVKKTKTNTLFSLREELPYEGGKPMYLVEEVDDRSFLKTLFDATLEGLK